MRSFIDNLERHANAVYWSDGLLDLLAGASLVVLGVGWLIDLVVFGAFAPALVVPLWSALRGRLVESRRGYMKLGERRQQDQRRLIVAMLVAGVGSLILGVGLYLLEFDAAILIRALPGSLIGIAALVTGAALELRRFAIYAVALVGVGIGSGLTGYNPGWAFVVGGALAVLIGAGLLIRFLRRYPVAVGVAETRSEPG